MLADMRAAFAFLTILPLGHPGGRKPGWSFSFFPLAGLVIGGALTAVALQSPFERDLTAFFILLIWVTLSGGLHLDGFGDCCDGLLASVAPGERLRIMKDSRAGVWAVVGLCLLLLGKWLALRSLSAEWIVLAPVLGRWALVMAAVHFPYVGGDGLGAYWREGLGKRQLLIASATVVPLLTRAEIAALWLLVFGVSLLIGAWAARRLGGGISGDVYGAICELCELICLLALGLIYG